MNMTYSPDLKAQLTWNAQKRVQHILHTQEYFRSEKANPQLAAIDYLNTMAETFQIPRSQLRNLHLKASFLDPREQGIEYRLYEVKKFFASATYGYYQTIMNVPVWRAGMTVTVKENPYRIVHADHYGHDDLKVQLPRADVIERVRTALFRIDGDVRRLRSLTRDRAPQGAPTPASFRSVFPGATAPTTGMTVQPLSWLDEARITRGLFYVYRYDAKARIPEQALILGERSARHKGAGEAVHQDITLPLPPVPGTIRNGSHYLVVEIIFRLGTRDRLNWKALVEVESGAILWLRAMTSGVNGLVFLYDPKTGTGNLANTPDSTNAVLDPLRVDVVLLNLDVPVMGTQALAGTNVALFDDDAPTVAAPTQPSGSDFDYASRTNDFAAVSAYYHCNNVFATIEDLGFDLATYFDGTTFPVHVDHRASAFDAGGIEVNAFCNGDGPTALTGDGIGLVGFCLSDDTGMADTTTNPLGRSVDKWVHWHEVGGHGILYDHVSGPNFGFSHSAGDSLAAFQNDPESQLRSLPERFQYAPFRDWPVQDGQPSSRWFNRAPADGWGWGGTFDINDATPSGIRYQQEQILATTLFRVYRSLGGDADQVPKRWHASRVATYLVLNAVGKLTPGTNPDNALGFYNNLVDADADDWTSEGYAGGAYNKVIRWSFERQGLWQAPGAPVPTTQPGAPPAVDLYIDDGRHGEYQYQAVHWNNPSVWNRTIADGGLTEDPGVAGVASYAYVKVKNRGTSNASGIVKVYHCNPGAGLTWPTDFQQAGPAAGLATGTVLAGNGNEVTVGPFEWTPNVNAYGHDCLLAIVTADGDPSNVANLEPGQTIQEWRLVPHDNNVGQRNVQLVPGAGGGEAMFQSMNGAWFFAGNNFNKTAAMEVKVEVPRVFQAKGWRLQVEGGEKFRLKPGEKRRIELKLSKGGDFTADEIRKAGDVLFNVYLYGNGMLMGGMTYRVDPGLRQRPLAKGAAVSVDSAQRLLGDLKLGPGVRVRDVRIRRISVDIDVDDDRRE